MNPISILYIRSTKSPFIGGANRIIWETLQAIDNESFRIIPVFIINDNKRVSFPCKKSFNDNSYYEVRGKRFFNLKVFKVLLDIIQSENISIIHSHEFKSNIYAFLLKLVNRNIIIISTVHGYFTHSLRGVFYIFFDKILLSYFDRAILVTSALDKKVFINRKKKVLIHNFINTDKWHQTSYNRSPETICIGFCGRISKEKGWKEFVLLSEILVGKKMQVKFLIAGDGPDYAAMQQFVKHKQLDRYYVFFGAVRDMRLFYASIDILLAPSLTEGLPLAQLEANAMSIPVVATRVGGVGDLITEGHNGFLSNLDEFKLLAEKLVHLINSPSDRLIMGKNGRIRVENHFSSINQIKKYEQLYRSLIQKSGSFDPVYETKVKNGKK